MLRKISALPFLQYSAGRQVVSLWASRLFEHRSIKQFFGLNLVAAIVVMGIVTPEANNVLAQAQVSTLVQSTPITETPVITQTTLGLPLTQFRVSQLYSFWHPAVDMVAPLGTPVMAIAAGTVEFADSYFFGYGKHVIIAHEHGLKSLYAHLSEFKTVVGRKVARGEVIGNVGSSGWATGNHLHLEIYQDGKTINPLELLPLSKQDIVYDGNMYQPHASASATPVQSDSVATSEQNHQPVLGSTTSVSQITTQK